MTMRSAYEWEAAFLGHGHDDEKRMAWIRAIQRDALEAASNICHKHSVEWPSGVGYQACRECAHAIGDLIHEELKPWPAN